MPPRTTFLGTAMDGNGWASFLCSDLEAVRAWGGPFNGDDPERPDGSDADIVVNAGKVTAVGGQWGRSVG